MAGRDTNTGAKRARQLRAELDLPPAAPIDCLLTLVEQRLGIPVVVAALPGTVAGCCWRDGDRVVLWVNGTQAVVRQRFTLAHELGHVRCRHDADVAVDTFETLHGRTTDSREIQANAFAAELLAPAAGIQEVAPAPTLDELLTLACRYGISTIAALYRLRTVGVAHDHEALRQAIEENLHHAAWERLRPPVVEDALATLAASELPRLSPSIRDSALASVLAGRATMQAAATAASCDARVLARGAAAIGI